MFQKHKENRRINMQLLFFNKKDDVILIEDTHYDVYEKIPKITKENSRAYVLIAMKETSLNNDIRCH